MIGWSIAVLPDAEKKLRIARMSGMRNLFYKLTNASCHWVEQAMGSLVRLFQSRRFCFIHVVRVSRWKIIGAEMPKVAPAIFRLSAKNNRGLVM